MRRPLLLTSLLALVALSGCVASRTTVVRSVDADGAVTVETFDSSLSPYGSWVFIPGYGRAWQPSVSYVGSDFYPYGTGGNWVMSDAGWVFDSAYPFGWAVFHYGRWHRDPFRGWCWFPGTQWAPSWVSWRTGGPYVGWAPLGPYGAPQFHDRHWTFVEARLFTGPNVYRYSVHPSRFHHAVSVTSPYRSGPPATYISQHTNHRISAVPVNRLNAASRPVPPPPSAYRSAGVPSRAGAPLPPPSQGAMRAPPPMGGYRREGLAAPPPPSGGGYRAAPAPMMQRPSYAPRSAPSWGQRAPPPPAPSMQRPSYAPRSAPSWGQRSAPSMSRPSSPPRSMPSRPMAPPPPPRR